MPPDDLVMTSIEETATGSLEVVGTATRQQRENDPAAENTEVASASVQGIIGGGRGDGARRGDIQGI